MTEHFNLKLLLFLVFLATGINAQTIEDDFEGNGNIKVWSAIDCLVNSKFANPVAQGINTSATVLKYIDYGGLWGNVYFDAGQNLNIAAHPVFSLKIFVPSGSITGNQDNQVILKLQNSKIIQPWQTQTLITKPIVLDQWQVVDFDFSTDTYFNFDSNSPAPVERTDFDRVLIQVNGEFNTDLVVAYIDDFFHANSTPVPPPNVYNQLIWSDEFDIDGSLDNSKWFHQTIFPIGNSWFGGELQHYTDRLTNSYVKDGVLRVVAQKEVFTNYGVTKQYTSARLNAKFAFTYGRVECRAKLPAGAGTLPAIWMLGKNINEKGAYWQAQGFGTLTWPNCGELDIMEHWGADQNNVTSAVHTLSTYTAAPGTMVNSAGQYIETATSEFHIYALEWTADKIVFTIDDAVHYTYQPAIKNLGNWPFDKDLYLLINTAILPTINPTFTQNTMEVDYIRIYKEGSVGIAESESNTNIKIFPNPVYDEMTLELNTALSCRGTFKVYDIKGSLVFSGETNIENGQTQLKGFDTLQKGMYILAYTIDGLNGKVKFMK